MSDNQMNNNQQNPQDYQNIESYERQIYSAFSQIIQKQQSEQQVQNLEPQPQQVEEIQQIPKRYFSQVDQIYESDERHKLFKTENTSRETFKIKTTDIIDHYDYSRLNRRAQKQIDKQQAPQSQMDYYNINRDRLQGMSGPQLVQYFKRLIQKQLSDLQKDNQSQLDRIFKIYHDQRDENNQINQLMYKSKIGDLSQVTGMITQFQMFQKTQQDIIQNAEDMFYKVCQIDKKDGNNLNSQVPQDQKKNPQFQQGACQKLKKMIANIKQAINKEYQLDCKDNCEWTPLHYASRSGHLDIVKILIEKGKVNIDSLNSNGNTALHLAAKNNHYSVCQYLIEQATPKKADVLIKGLDNDTPWKSAIDHGHDDLAKYLKVVEVKAKHWQNRNCLLKLYLNKADNTIFQKFSLGVFKEIIKYA